MTFAIPIRQEHLDGARLVYSREVQLSLLPSGGAVCEVGVWKGEFSRLIVAATHPRELHLVDISLERFERAPFEEAIAEGRIILHEADSADCLASFPDEHFDWIYIDGDHRLAGVTRDVAAARGKVRPGGFLVFNDYVRWTRKGTQYGTIPAVNALVSEGGWRVAWLALSPGGYHDLALQRL